MSKALCGVSVATVVLLGAPAMGQILPVGDQGVFAAGVLGFSGAEAQSEAAGGGLTFGAFSFSHHHLSASSENTRTRGASFEDATTGLAAGGDRAETAPGLDILSLYGSGGVLSRSGGAALDAILFDRDNTLGGHPLTPGEFGAYAFAGTVTGLTPAGW